MPKNCQFLEKNIYVSKKYASKDLCLKKCGKVEESRNKI